MHHCFLTSFWKFLKRSFWLVLNLPDNIFPAGAPKKWKCHKFLYSCQDDDDKILVFMYHFSCLLECFIQGSSLNPRRGFYNKQRNSVFQKHITFQMEVFLSGQSFWLHHFSHCSCSLASSWELNWAEKLWDLTAYGSFQWFWMSDPQILSRLNGSFIL